MGIQINLVTTIQKESALSFWELIKEDWIAHGRDWTKPGFQAVATHRFGVWRHSIKSKVLQLPFRFIYGTLYRRVRNIYGIELPPNVKLGRRVVIEHQGAIVIHEYSSIGDDCIIRQGVTLGMRRNDCPTEAPSLGRNVDVGAGAKILGNVTIGDNAKIGANAVVLCNVPAGRTAVGIPAKIISSKICSNQK
ncbi:serine O-acetyltransferase [Calothrix sp. NIES-4071]|nr:serine O-acetyltransferase [Calothrix sp. NIES-4071]BAZ54541.1 serine O-acetyltransferase [Calothrix sp. NIES-4105]